MPPGHQQPLTRPCPGIELNPGLLQDPRVDFFKVRPQDIHTKRPATLVLFRSCRQQHIDLYRAAISANSVAGSADWTLYLVLFEICQRANQMGVICWTFLHASRLPRYIPIELSWDGRRPRTRAAEKYSTVLEDCPDWHRSFALAPMVQALSSHGRCGYAYLPRYQGFPVSQSGCG